MHQSAPLRPLEPIFTGTRRRGSVQVGGTPATPPDPLFIGIGDSAAADVVPVPGNLQASDLMLVCLRGPTTMNPTNPGGWTELYNQTNPGGYARDLAAFIKFAVGSETTFNFAATGFGQMYTFRNIDQSNPLDVAIVQGTAYSGSSFTAPTITTATDGALLFAYDEVREPDTAWSINIANGYEIAVQDFVQACYRLAGPAGEYEGWTSNTIGGVQRGTTIAFRAMT